ncbi:EAL domain-containing protein [Paenibacillus thermoaerophilus]|uniref:EAL domain-containing protein n=1 Tax=Paenibacillus thermoaerophilus TaxID=1215385 RepID=A0ABW2V5B1_9BACL|nr:EAL domain-containing protein [Paenibacillus thermoaerophilus]
MKGRLAVKITAILALALIVAFGGSAAYNLAGLYRTCLSEGERLAEKESVAYSRELLRQFDGTISMLETLRAELLQLREEHGDNRREQFTQLLQRLLEERRELLGLYTMWEPNAFDGNDLAYANASPYHDRTGRFLPYVVRIDGRIAAIPVKNDSLPGLNDFYEIPKRTRSFAMLEPFWYDVEGKPVTVTSFVLPILDERNDFLGIVGADFSLDSIQADISFVRPLGGYATLITANGVYLANGRFPEQVLRTYIDRSDTRDLLSRALLSDSPLKVYTPSSGGGEELHLFQPIRIKDEKWLLETVIPKDDLLTNYYRQLRWTLLVALSAAGALILLCAALLRRLVAARLRLLTEAIRKVAAGDWSTRVEIPSGDEFEQAAAAFNRMVDSRRESEERILYQAYHDPLTELPNRLKLHKELEAAADAAGRLGQPFAVYYIDLDQFKWFNDTLDHTAGDLLLRQIARRLRKAAGEDDPVYRFGSDEFVRLSAGGVSPEAIRQAAEHMLAAVSEPVSFGDRKLHVTASIGIAVWSPDDPEGRRLIKQANMALLEAKQERNTYRIFNPDPSRPPADGDSALESAFEDSLQSGHFLLYYQPIYDLRTGRVSGVEALVRWRHPELGLLLPEQFIGAAERTGFILQLGDWVLRSVCRQLAAWDSMGIRGLRASVNLSPVQIQQRTLGERLAGLVKEAGSSVSRIDLEMNERCFLPSVQAAAVLGELRQRGFRLTLDDFGTGYSSLTYLRTMPFDRLKLDPAMIGPTGAGGKERELIKSVVGFARQLGMTVVAEGVETDLQVEAVRAGGCDYAQGYAFAPPMSAEDLTRKLWHERN